MYVCICDMYGNLVVFHIFLWSLNIGIDDVYIRTFTFIYSVLFSETCIDVHDFMHWIEDIPFTCTCRSRDMMRNWHGVCVSISLNIHTCSSTVIWRSPSLQCCFILWGSGCFCVACKKIDIYAGGAGRPRTRPETMSLIHTYIHTYIHTHIYIYIHKLFIAEYSQRKDQHGGYRRVRLIFVCMRRFWEGTWSRTVWLA